MKKNTCPHCGAWGQLSKFCQRCGNSLIYSDIQSAQEEFKDKQIAPSTQFNDMVWIVASALLIASVIYLLLS